MTTTNSAIQPLTPDDQITISLYVPPGCDAAAKLLVQQFQPCCDLIRLYLHPGYSRDWDTEPNRLQVSDGLLANVLVDHTGLPGYHIIMSADLVYPHDYVPAMIRKIERYKRTAIVGLGGTYILHPRGHRTLKLEHAMAADMPIHILDMRTAAYHRQGIRHSLTGDLALEQAWKPVPSTALGIAAQIHKMPMITVQHPQGWVYPRPGHKTQPEHLDATWARYIRHVNIWALFAAGGQA